MSKRIRMQTEEEKLKIHRHRYFYITAVIIIMFLIFQLVGNFVYILIEADNRKIKDDLTDYGKLLGCMEMNRAESSGEGRDNRITLIYCDSRQKETEVLKRQLKNQKEAYRMLTSLSEAGQNPRQKTEILFILKEEITKEETAELTRLSKAGIHLIFAEMPSEESLKDNDLSDLMGIRRYLGSRKDKGVYVIEDFFLGDGFNAEGSETVFAEVLLKQGCKTYAYSQLENQRKQTKVSIKNEELPPLIWRYIPDKGEIFVINGGLFQTSAQSGIIAAIYAQIIETYLYPVINADCFLLKNFPYTDDVSSVELTKLYSRGSLILQQDILFPSIAGWCSKYSLKPTYYTSSYEELKEGSNKALSYYAKQIISQLGELAYYDREKELLLSKEGKAGSLAQLWEADMDWYMEEEEKVVIPIITAGDKNDGDAVIAERSASTAFGFLSVMLNISDIIYPDKDNPVNFVELSRNFDTVLYMHKDRYGYLEPLTVQDAVKRILIYNNLQTEIKTGEKKIEVTCDNLTADCFYILRTDQEIKAVKQGEITKISDHAYLVKQTAADMQILLKERNY